MSPIFRKAHLLLFVVPAILVAVAYLPTLQYGKVWDDWLLIGDFEHYSDPGSWLHTLALPLPFSDNYFRPLVMLTYILEGYLRLGDFVSHLANVGIHAINACLVGIVALRILTGRPRLVQGTAAIVGAIYGLHPAMTEAVTWVAGRFDLLATSFVLLAIVADIYIRNVAVKAMSVGACFLAALLCKEMAITLPFILLFLNFAAPDKYETRHLARQSLLAVSGAMAVALFVYLSIRYYSLGYLLIAEPEMASINLGSPLQRLLLIGAAFSGYLTTILVPFSHTQPLHYTSLPIPVDGMGGWFGLSSLLTVLCLILIFVRRSSTRFSALCFATAVVTLLPVLHVRPVPMLVANMLTADRATMVPLIFVLLGVGQAALLIRAPNKFASVSLGAATWLIVSFLVVRSILPLWQNDYTLWSWLASDIPECSTCRANHAKYLIYTWGPEPGLKEAEIAIATAAQPWQEAMAWGVKAMALRKLGRTEEAINAAKTAAQIEPVPKAKASYELQQASMLIEGGKTRDAVIVLHHAISIGGGTSTEAFTQLGNLALATDRPDIARELYKKAFAFSTRKKREAMLAKTEDPEQWVKLGNSLAADNLKIEADLAYKEAQRLRRKILFTQ